MSAYISANFSKAFIGATIGVSDTAMTVQGGGTLPTGAGNFVLILWNSSLYNNPAQDPNAEFVIASFSSGNVFNITRGQEGTIAVPHAINDSATLVFSSGVRSSDLTYLGTKQVDETNIADGNYLGYSISEGKIVYITPPTPPSGYSGTITTAKLTTGGTEGSITFVNGILTVQTPAT